ncbi:MAG: DUF1800 domain-containing protein [Rhodobacteraceae bacterium]|nr:DUF1800 domain-containing protein [Paracoccaceae bacterium]
MHRAFLTATAILMGTSALAAPDALTRAEARHLVARTGFGASPAEIQNFTGMSAETAVAQIIAGLQSEPTTPMPEWATGWIYPYEPVWTLSQTEQELFYTNRYLEMGELTAWWMAEMVSTPSPLTERLTLFWHDHFATSFENEENSQWMAHQNAFFRRHAAGNFADLAHGILRDPAMLTYLSNTENFADDPNENLGREFLELFTLGEGRGYTEADVKEAARALTGHSVGDDFKYAFYAEDHDNGRKTILGKTGRFDATGLADTVLNDANFGPYVVEKLWQAFISPTPDPAEVTRLTAVWKDAGLELKPLLEALFLTDAFWDETNRGSLIKSPVELIAGTIRTTGRADVPMSETVWILEEMGQHLFHPPNVAGWEGGEAWINTSSALMRSQVLTYLIDEGFDGPDGMQATQAEAAPALPEDALRVGRVFGQWAEYTEEGGTMGVITLFDVSHGAETFRNLNVVLEEAEDDDGVAIWMHVDNCGPICTGATRAFAEDYDGWFGVYLFDDEAEIEAPLADGAEDMLRTVIGQLPSLFAETETSLAWQPVPDDEYTPPTYAVLAGMADRAAMYARGSMGAPGELILAPSRAGSDGIAGLSMMSSVDDIDDYVDDFIATREIYSAPATTYASAEAWLAAYPERYAAMEALLPLPTPLPATLTNADAEEWMRALLLSPAYQIK